jgi:septal ring factor EnvC (AmiA/AmiB activator)
MIIDFNLATFTLEISMTFPDEPQNAFHRRLTDAAFDPTPLLTIATTLSHVSQDIKDLCKTDEEIQKLNKRIAGMSETIQGLETAVIGCKQTIDKLEAIVCPTQESTKAKAVKTASPPLN